MCTLLVLKLRVFCFAKDVFSVCVHILVQQFLGLASQLHPVGTDDKSPFATSDAHQYSSLKTAGIRNCLNISL